MKRKLFTGMIAMSLGIVLSGVEPQKIVFDNLDNQFESTTAKGTWRGKHDRQRSGENREMCCFENRR